MDATIEKADTNSNSPCEMAGGTADAPEREACARVIIVGRTGGINAGKRWPTKIAGRLIPLTLQLNYHAASQPRLYQVSYRGGARRTSIAYPLCRCVFRNHRNVVDFRMAVITSE